MQGVSIQTSQNIALDFELAGIGERLLAFLIDLFIILGFILGLFLFLELLNTGSDILRNSLFFLIGYGYRLVSEIYFNGQTAGKMALRIKVVKLDGGSPSFAAYFLRWLMEVFDFLIIGLGVVFIILTKKGQRIGDLLAGTTVVKIRKVSAINVQNKILMDKVDETYEPTFFEASHLSDVEVRLIKSALKTYKENAVKTPALTIEQKLKQKYQIKSDLATVKFLYTLLRDHIYYVTK